MTPHVGLLTVHQLLASGAVLLCCVVACSWSLMREDRRRRQVLVRLDRFATPYARVNTLALMGRRRPTRSRMDRLSSGLKRLVGYNSVLARYYPVRPAIVLGAALLLSCGACQVLAGLLGTAAWCAAPIATVLASRKAFGYFEQRRTNTLYVQFPDALAMIVRAVRVGIPVSEAVRNVAREAAEPTSVEFGVLSDQIAIGVALDDALRGIAARNNLPEYRFFATSLALQSQTGGGVSETLENLADVIRKRIATRNRAHALASEARTSTYILAALPVFTGAALSLLNPTYMSLLFTDPMGKGVLAAAVGMLATGMTVMRMTITRTLR